MGDVSVLILGFVANFPVVDVAFFTGEYHFVVVFNHLDSVLGIAEQVEELVGKDVGFLHFLDESLLAMLLVFELLRDLGVVRFVLAAFIF